MKTCTKCLQQMPLSNFYKNCRQSDGYFSRCKTCINGGKPVNEYNIDNVKNGYKLCRDCKKTFKTEFFRIDSRRPQGFDTICRECRNKRERNYNKTPNLKLKIKKKKLKLKIRKARIKFKKPPKTYPRTSKPTKCRKCKETKLAKEFLV